MSIRDRVLASGKSVAVLCGGDSTERKVSLVSGKSVAEAVEANGLPCELIDLETNRLPQTLDPARFLVLPVIHGSYGEDGRLSAELDQRGFAYAGCQQAASVLCYDKYASKSIASRLGIPVAADRLLFPQAPVDLDLLEADLGLPFILKPRLDGSSVGLHLVETEQAYLSAAADLEKTVYLAEAYLTGVDLTVGILADKALGVVAIRPEGGLYDYRHKYTSGMSQYEVPAKIDPAIAGDLADWSKAIYQAAGCRDMARIDFRLSEDGKATFLEINTVPGMTPTSLLPKSASCCGLTFQQLVLELIGLALDRSNPLTS